MKFNRIIKTRRLAFTLLISIATLSISAQAQTTHNDGLIKERRFRQLLKKENVVLLDVRTPEEYQNGYIPKAKLIDVLQSDFLDSIQGLDKNKTYLLYCRTGKRSQKALTIMKENGFKRVYHLKGGFSEWNGAKVTE